MSQQEYLRLKKEIVQRARVIPRPTSYQVQIERLRARQLAQFIRNRLNDLHLTQTYLAQELDIEREFVQTLVGDATFPVSELSAALLEDLAGVLRCDVSDLHQAMRINDPDDIDEHPGDRSIDLPGEYTVDIDE